MFVRNAITRSPLLCIAALAGTAASARAQITFSIDYFGPSIGLPNSFTGMPIRPSDILTPFTAGPGMPGFPMPGPLPIPGTLIPGGAAFASLAIPTYAGCIPTPPGVPCPNEVDALSYGNDAIPPLTAVQPPGTWVFSVDEFAVGIPGLPLAPNMRSEGTFFGVFDASADTFQSLGLPPSPVPFGLFVGNSGWIDGNGLPSVSGAVYPGVGVFEMRPPMVGPGPRPGDNIDALDIGPGPGGGIGGVYFSLDAGFFDPLRGIPNSGSALANGFLPGMVLNVPFPGAAIVVWAPPPMLGLDLGGVGTDDLDALAIQENGVAGLQLGVGGDVVRFSVRRGSMVVGMLDSLMGLPIEPGDILGLPVFAGAPPSIIVPAEALGLATWRSGFAPFGLGDDLDALDAVYTPGPVPAIAFCDPGVAGVLPCPCANPAAGPARGCDNSSFTGGASITAAGNASLGGDTLVFTTANERPTASSIVLQGSVATAGFTFGQGVRCVAGVLRRMYIKSAVGGSITAPTGIDPRVSVRSAALGDPIAAGTSRYYGVYYRDPIILGGCPATAGFNITNQLAVYWVP